MGYSKFKSSPKDMVTGEEIGSGEIDLQHLGPALYSLVQRISLHNHSGVKSRRLLLSDMDGAFGKTGFLLYSNDGSKRYRVTVDNSGVISAVEA